MDLVLDTSLLLGGKEPPPGDWMTTPEAAAEISPGGRDARRFQFWVEQGLQVRSAADGAQMRVDEAALAAGNLGRLSDADRSLLALALERKALLVTDDHTMLDLAMRLSLATQTVNSTGVDSTKNWRHRCAGCGRWFDEAQKRDECPICGSEVKLKPVPKSSS